MKFSSTRRSLAVLGISATLVLAVASPALAHRGGRGGPGGPGGGRPCATSSSTTSTTVANQPFNVSGFVTAVDAAAKTITVEVHGGRPCSLTGTTVTLTLGTPSSVSRNRATATLASAKLNDQVDATGVRDDDAAKWIAYRVNLRGTGLPATTSTTV